MIHNNLFETDIDTLAVQLLPIHWRNPIHVAFVKVFVLPFKLQLQRLRSERTRNIYLLEHDSRVGRLEKVLNDRFDFSERRIRIGSGNRIQSLYLYTEAEAKETYIPETIYTSAEIASRNTDFTVLIPSVLNIRDTELDSLHYLVTYYAGKDKQYKIEIV
jgi:hypothetical protein